MQRRFRRIAQFQPDAVGDQSIKAGAFIHFVKVRQRFSGKQFVAGHLVMNRRPINVVQQSLHEIGCRCEILQPLLILDSDGCATKLIGDPDSSNIHFALLKDLILREISFFIRPEMEFHSLEKAANRKFSGLLASDTVSIFAYKVDWLSLSL